MTGSGTFSLGGGRVLHLCDDAARIERQLAGADLSRAEAGEDLTRAEAGEDLTRAEAGALRDDISTDEITPLSTMTVWDERLGRVPYTGLKVGGRLPIGRDAVKAGGFTVVVAGGRYGKGSSREHSPMAEWHAGIRLVIAESFERIYRQNADNVGLLTCTDLGIVERLRAGEVIALDELLQGRDAMAAAIVRAGGLMRYGRARMAGLRPVPASPPSHADVAQSSRPLTLAEKIVARHLLAAPVDPPPDIASGTSLVVHPDWRFIHEYYTGMAAHLLAAEYGDGLRLHEPASILAFEDHMSYSARSALHVQGGLLPTLAGMLRAHRDFVARHGLVHHASLASSDGGHRLEAGVDGGSEGISHPMITERYALPGQLVAGTDSHTPHAGAIGCLAFGVGSTDMANGFATGAVRMTMPPVLRIELTGPLPAGTTAKDVVLHLLADPALRAGAALGRLVEFTGSAVRGFNTDERATLTNMTAELGGFSGIVAPDEETVRFLRERRGITFTLEPWMTSDEGAAVEATLAFDCRTLGAMLAAPGDPGRGVPVDALPPLGQRPRPGIAYGGSCTGGKREDFDQYHAVLAWAAARGLNVAPATKLYLQFGTLAVRDYCAERGYLAAFEAVGAELLMPSCGACANCGPGASTSEDDVTISAINRNFPGRSGPGQVWLASPPTVAASAIAGEIVSFEELRQVAVVTRTDCESSAAAR
ncbi:MAG: 3-isopropylmalate dehydratase [Burkholderiaceae bacterium]|nr:3-isopropylmalate dehydratase [Burkholderiaceae bacterium]